MIRISHPTTLPIRQVTTSGLFETKNSEFLSFYEEKDSPGLSSLLFDFGGIGYFNGIELHPSPEGGDFFPDTFRFELSQDGKAWEPVLQESGFKRSANGIGKWIFSLTSARYVKLVSKISKRTSTGKSKLQFGKVKFLVTGVKEIKASSELDRLWVKENLLDGRVDYGWSSRKKEEPSDEFLVLDLGGIHRLDEMRMLTKNEFPNHFPEQFVVFTSEDDLTWHQIHQESGFLSEPGIWYLWKFTPVNLRYLKLVFTQEKVPNHKEYVTEIIEIELFSKADHKEEKIETPESKITLPYATVLRSGIVRLAVDGEIKEGVALQSSDRRLRDASTEYKGIVELATDGEEKPGKVVQGNDKRLKQSTELTIGLVRLARSGESKPQLVVQSDDERLKQASTDSFGIVELALDGETRPGVVVQGNDSRLKKATLKSSGLVQLAELGEDHPDKVITGNDPRLKEATVTAKGIVRLAQNGEESPGSVVQGNDKRLQLATTEQFGIVQLARSGEVKSGVVVQGDDKRLVAATEENFGIVQMASHGSTQEGKAVKASDPRLSDSRNPLPHEHEYAAKQHDFNSHSGLLQIEGETSSDFKGIVPPQFNDSVIYAKNKASGTGVIGLGGSRGLAGFSEGTGVIGISKSKDRVEAGVLGLSSGAPGGQFISQSDYALFANGLGNIQRDWKGSGKAVLAQGESLFEGVIRISKDGQEECIARYFKLDQKDVISPGDLLIATDEAGVLSRSKQPYSTNVIGVCVGNPSVVLGKEVKSLDHVLVALFGLVRLHVDAQPGSIQPGDLLVSGLSSGHAIKSDPNKLKPGCIVAKALEPWKKDKGTILALLSFA